MGSSVLCKEVWNAERFGTYVATDEKTIINTKPYPQHRTKNSIINSEVEGKGSFYLLIAWENFDALNMLSNGIITHTLPGSIIDSVLLMGTLKLRDVKPLVKVHRGRQ